LVGYILDRDYARRCLTPLSPHHCDLTVIVAHYHLMTSSDHTSRLFSPNITATFTYFHRISTETCNNYSWQWHPWVDQSANWLPR